MAQTSGENVTALGCQPEIKINCSRVSKKRPARRQGLVKIPHGWAASPQEKSTTLGVGGKCQDRCRSLVKIPHGWTASPQEKSATLIVGGKCPDRCWSLVKIPHGYAVSPQEKSTTLGVGGKCPDRCQSLIKIPHGEAASNLGKIDHSARGHKLRRPYMCPLHQTRSTLAPNTRTNSKQAGVVLCLAQHAPP